MGLVADLSSRSRWARIPNMSYYMSLAFRRGGCVVVNKGFTFGFWRSRITVKASGNQTCERK